MREPLVSVIMPVFNGEKYLRVAIESVLRQTFRDFEIVLVDDGSTDSTPDIARSYGKAIRYFRQANSGAARAFNHGLKVSQGRYVSWLSHDDAFVETKLEKQVAALQRAGQPAVCYTDIHVIDAQGTDVAEHRLPEVPPAEILRHVLTGGPVGAASYSIVYDRACIDAVGPYDESWRCTEDAEMLLRLVRRFPLLHVAESLMQMREHELRAVRSRRWEREVIRFVRAHLHAIPLDDLFPEFRARRVPDEERARAYLWLGNALASRNFPIYTLAYAQYARAFRAHPSGNRWLIRLIGRLAQRHATELLQRRTARLKQAFRTKRNALLPTATPPRRTHGS